MHCQNTPPTRKWISATAPILDTALTSRSRRAAVIGTEIAAAAADYMKSRTAGAIRQPHAAVAYTAALRQPVIVHNSKLRIAAI
jgi:hypothetical protein